MLGKILLALALTFGVATAAIAVGSGGSTTTTTTTSTSSSKYATAVKAVKAGKYSRAITLLQDVVSKDPQNANAWNYLGFSNRKLKKFDTALVAYKNALTIDPRHKGAHEYLGELYLQTGDLPKAKLQLASLKKLCPFGCEQLNDLKGALSTYETANGS